MKINMQFDLTQLSLLHIRQYMNHMTTSYIYFVNLLNQIDHQDTGTIMHKMVKATQH